MVKSIIDVAVGETRPDLTLLLLIPQAESERRLLARQSTMPFMRDRMEEADQSFFARVAKGYHAIAVAEPGRVRPIDASGTVEGLEQKIWALVKPRLQR